MKRTLVGATVALLALTLTGCGGNDSPPTSGPGTSASDAEGPGPGALADATGVTEVTFWHPLGGANGEALEGLIAEFNAENEGKIEVSSSFQGAYADLLAKYTASLKDDSVPTVLLAGDVASGFLKDVQHSLSPEAMEAANPEDLQLDQIRAAGKNYYSSDGKLLAVPFNMSTPVLWVNTDMARAAGVDLDTDLATLSDVAAAARKIKDTTGFAGLVQPFDGWWFEQATAASGNVYCAPDNGRGAGGQATAISLGESLQVDAFATLADLYTSGVGLDVGVDGNAALTAFTGGQVGLMFNSSGAAGGIASANVPFNYTALPYPVSGDPSEAGPIIGGSALWMGSTAIDAQKVAGWKLVSFLTSARSQEEFSHATGYVPVNTDVDDSPTQKEWIAGHPFTEVFVDQVNNTPSVPATAGCLSGAMTAIRSAVVPQMQAAFSGSISLDDAISNAEAEANNAIDQYREQLG